MKKKNYFSKMKGIGRTCLLWLALGATTHAFADITTGLKVHYTFDNVSGISVPDVSGNMKDAMLMGAPVVVPGNTGDGVQLPTVSDFVQLPNGVTGALTSFTVSTWVKLDAANTWARVFDFGSNTDNYMFLTVSSNANAVRFAFKNAAGTTGTTEQMINGTAKLPTGSWVHVAVTVAYADGIGTGRLYVNGVQVGVNNAITITPAMLDATTGAPTTQNYIGKSQWPDPALAGIVDDFRIYNRALTNDDVLELTGVPGELINQWKALNLPGDLTNVTSNLTLPTTMGTQGVKVRWASTNNAVVDTFGVVTRSKFDVLVKLTATLSLESNGKTHTLVKSFDVTVPAPEPVPDEVAKWNFIPQNITIENGVTKVKDEFDYGFNATLMNEAKIRTIGKPESKQFNVLDLGNGKGYMDMGTEIGEQIYSLNNYTMSAFFRIDNSYNELNSNGNFIWNFSNTTDAPTDKNGYIIGSLKNQSQNVTSGYWEVGDQGVGKWQNAPKASANAADKNGWHHMAYVQDGNTGTVYIDGEVVATGPMTNLPSLTLPKPGMTGTPYNWLGRPCYPTDVYLRKTLVYGFTIYRASMTRDDIINTPLMATQLINELNDAYAQDSNYQSPALANEVAALTMTGLDAVTSNLTLPTRGTLDNAITISWKSSHPMLISNTGEVTRPDYYDFKVKLTAQLTKNGQIATKEFVATVKVKPGTQFTNDLLVKFDFAADKITNDTIVKDAGEKQFTGIVKNNAKVVTIGTSKRFNVLSLGDSIGYFDMGAEMGKIMYHLKDYTIGAYFRVDESYTALNSNGNFLWSLSNSTNQLAEANGYVFTGLKNQNLSITPTHYANESGISLQQNALQGAWHHIAYTQFDSTGVLYIDGQALLTGTVKPTPSTVLQKDGLIGTPYNWLGRACYAGDVYLRKTLVSDFRIYSRALTSLEIESTEMNVSTTIAELNTAYAENTSVKALADSPYKVTATAGKIHISGLGGNETVSLFDITGRQLEVKNTANIPVKAGIYIVKINNYNVKVVVR